MPNDFQLDLFQLTPAEFRARYAAGLRDFNDEDIHHMRASASKPDSLLAVGLLNSGTSSVGMVDADAIVTKIVLHPNWAGDAVKTINFDTVPFSSSPAIAGATLYVFGAGSLTVEGNINNVEATLTSSDAVSVFFYGYTPAAS